MCELEFETVPTAVVGHFVYAAWPCELEEESPIYFRGKTVPTVKAIERAGEQAGDGWACVGIAVDAATFCPTHLCSVRVVTDGTCTLLREEFERLHDRPVVTGANVELANGLTVVVLVADTRDLLVHVSRT